MSDQEQATFPCVACGFLVFNEPTGSYDICPVCGWEDDHVQLRYPNSTVGANRGPLVDYQRDAINKLPLEIQECHGFTRDPLWRPLTPAEAVSPGAPTNGLTYFNAASAESPRYYWRK